MGQSKPPRLLLHAVASVVGDRNVTQAVATKKDMANAAPTEANGSPAHGTTWSAMLLIDGGLVSARAECSITDWDFDPKADPRWEKGAEVEVALYSLREVRCCQVIDIEARPDTSPGRNKASMSEWWSRWTVELRSGQHLAVPWQATPEVRSSHEDMAAALVSSVLSDALVSQSGDLQPR